jgi:hypothetical protein
MSLRFHGVSVCCSDCVRKEPNDKAMRRREFNILDECVNLEVNILDRSGHWTVWRVVIEVNTMELESWRLMKVVV